LRKNNISYLFLNSDSKPALLISTFINFYLWQRRRGHFGGFGLCSAGGLLEPLGQLLLGPLREERLVQCARAGGARGPPAVQAQWCEADWCRRFRLGRVCYDVFMSQSTWSQRVSDYLFFGSSCLVGLGITLRLREVLFQFKFFIHVYMYYVKTKIERELHGALL